MLKQLYAVHASHLEIGQCQIKPSFFCKFDCRFTGSSRSYVVAFFRENHLKDLSLTFFVIYDQNVLSRHVFQDEGGSWIESNTQLAASIPSPFSLAGKI